MTKVNFDLNKPGERLNTPWTFGINTCHAFLWTRDDLNRHAKMVTSQCGLKYVRFHNFISKWTDVYNEDENGNPTYNFEIVDEIFDNVIKSGFLPFLEISFCPEAMADSDQHCCGGYEACTAMPKSYDKWEEMIKAIIEHFKDRYGEKSLKNWYFEVWNEPDLFSGSSMTKEIYFKLYDYTVRAVKSVDQDLRVGGPATSKCVWVKEFIEHIETKSNMFENKKVPCDFIATHAYPSDLAYLEADYGDVELQSSNVMYEMFKKVRDMMDNSSLSNLPLIMGEWNSSAGPCATNHDDKNNAAFIVKLFDDLKDVIDGSLYWAMSDVYQEQGFHYIPFHGGYGLITVNDIQKSSFNAFAMLEKVKGQTVFTKITGRRESTGVMAALDSEKSEFNAVFYNYTEPDAEVKEIEFDVEIDGINCEVASAVSSAVCDESGSAYEWWQKMGSPQFPNIEILKTLTEKSVPKTEHHVIFKDKTTGKYAFKVKLNPGDIALYKIKV